MKPPAKKRSFAQRARETSVDDILFSRLSTSLGCAIRRAQLAVFDTMSNLFDELDLKPVHYEVLSTIAIDPGLKQTQVSAAIGVKRTNLVAIVDDLEIRGLAHRRALPHDRRAYALHLTREGEDVSARMRAAHDDAEAKFAAALPPGAYQILLDLLRDLTRGLEQADSGAANSQPGA